MIHGTSSPLKLSCPECGQRVDDDGICTALPICEMNPRRPFVRKATATNSDSEFVNESDIISIDEITDEEMKTLSSSEDPIVLRLLAKIESLNIKIAELMKELEANDREDFYDAEEN